MPVCTGCFGIYAGTVIGFILLSRSRFENFSMKIFTWRYIFIFLSPMTIVFVIGTIISFLMPSFIYSTPPEFFEIFRITYFSLGLIFGFELCNIALRLTLINENSLKGNNQFEKIINNYGTVFSAILIFFIFVSISLFFFNFGYPTVLVFIGSFLFLAGLFILVSLIIAFSIRFLLEKG